jgi:cytoskeletal protein RodZ
MSGVSGDRGHLANGDSSVVVSTERPIFSDESGVRAAVLKWGVWAICLIAVVLGSALVLTLRTHVPLPAVDRLLPPSRAEIEREAGLPTEELSSQPVEPSIRLRPSLTFRPSPTATSPNARPSVAVNRAVPTAGATSVARSSTKTPATQAKSSDQATTRARNPNAATPSPQGRATSKHGNSPG